MKQLVLFLTIVILLKPLWPIVEYTINYKYIVEVLCENKDKPELSCNGKCYLAKQLVKDSADKEKNPFRDNKSKFELSIIDCLQIESNKLEYFNFVIHTFKRYSESNSELFLLQLLQPPELVIAL